MKTRTSSFATLTVSPECHEEIKQRLLAGGYNHAFQMSPRSGLTINMDGIALVSEEPILPTQEVNNGFRNQEYNNRDIDELSAEEILYRDIEKSITMFVEEENNPNTVYEEDF